MNAPRLLAGLVVSALGVWFLVAVFSSTGGSQVPATQFLSSKQCQECHPKVWEEWDGSQHSISWNNPATRFLSNDFANQDCIDCHAPRPVFVTGIGERVLPRDARRHEGVDCLSCHQLPDGGMAGTIVDPKALCRPVQRLELTRPEFCAGCHNQHKTVDQWRASKYPDQDMDCLSCHMPYRNGDPNAGRDHTFLGGNDMAMLKRAVALRGVREDGKWIVEVENVGAGHAFPTDERSRTSDLFWRPTPPAGEEPGPWRFLHRIRDPYRTETDIPSTLLHAGELRRLPLDDDEAKGAVQVALFYKRSPYWEDPEAPDPDREAILVYAISLAP